MDYIIESINNEISIENGIDTDVLYINNDVGDEKNNDILYSYNDTKTRNGKIIVDKRENINGSFGAYYDMVFKYENEYDYFFFCEDDVMIYKENYLKEFVDFLNDDSEVGFVSLAPISDVKYPPHSGGGCGLTSKEIFFKVNSKEKVDKFFEQHQKNRDVYSKLQHFEIEFTNAFHREGYRLKNHPKFSPLSKNYEKHPGHISNFKENYKDLEFIYKVGN